MRRISTAAGLAAQACILPALLCALPLVSPAWAGTYPHDRTGFMIGFGVGGASLGVENGDEREGSVTGNFRIGYSLRPDLVIHFEGNGWSKSFDDPIGDVTWSFTTATGALTWFPTNIGVFVRGGIGFGTANVEVHTGGLKVSDDGSGLGFLVAGGYEWRLSRKFALGPQVEYSYMDVSDLQVDIGTADMIGGSLNFNWYW